MLRSVLRLLIVLGFVSVAALVEAETFLLDPGPDAPYGMTRGRYLTGAWVGTLVGFGAGHYVHGEAGFGTLYLLLESAAVTVVAGGAIGASLSGLCDYDCGPNVDRKGLIVVSVGASIYALLRAFEVADVWRRPWVRGEERRRKAAETARFMVAPMVSDSAQGFSAALRF